MQRGTRCMPETSSGRRGRQVAQSLIQVAGLVMPELLIEIKVVAHA